MEEKDYLDLLVKREIQPTAIRTLVLQTMLKAGRSVSLLDLEKILDTVDKSSISRTITLFLFHHLVHSIGDRTGSFKYVVCSVGCSCKVNDLHTHFRCEGCNKTFYLNNIPTSVVQVPEGLTLSSTNYVLKRLCPECAARSHKKGRSYYFSTLFSLVCK